MYHIIIITDLLQQFEFIPRAQSRPLNSSSFSSSSFSSSFHIRPCCSSCGRILLVTTKIKRRRSRLAPTTCFFAVRCLSRPQRRTRRRGEHWKGDEKNKTISCCRIPESVVIFSSPSFHFQRQTNTFQHLTLEKSNIFFPIRFPPLMICSPPCCHRRSSQVIICLKVSLFDAGVEAPVIVSHFFLFYVFLFFFSLFCTFCFDIL